jgi:hypothetical protein
MRIIAIGHLIAIVICQLQRSISRLYRPPDGRRMFARQSEASLAHRELWWVNLSYLRETIKRRSARSV